jgi:hypothetical protein
MMVFVKPTRAIERERVRKEKKKKTHVRLRERERERERTGNDVGAWGHGIWKVTGKEKCSFQSISILLVHSKASLYKHLYLICIRITFIFSISYQHKIRLSACYNISDLNKKKKKTLVI